MRLLLIHAFPLDASMWENQLDIEGADEVAAPNLPGFGGTEVPGDTMTMVAAAAVCAEALAGKPAVVCGLSMGGYVALELWRSHPELVAGLVLANTRAEADDDEGRNKRAGLAARLDSEGSDFLVAQPPPLLSADAPEWLREHVATIIGKQPAAAIAAAARGMAARPDSTSTLGSIDVPTLIITSTEDALIPADITSPMAGAIPGASLATIEGVGHLSNLEAPEVFNELLATHLERCAQGQP